MKFKISFNKQSIIDFFLVHVEKIAFGIFFLAFAAILYGAMMRREKFDETPAGLINKCDSAKHNLEGERTDLLKELDKNKKNFADEAKQYQQIELKYYATSNTFDKPLFGQKGKRGQPETFGADELRASADMGVFLLSEKNEAGARVAPTPSVRGGRTAVGARQGAGGATALRNKHWVLITGLVPFEKQRDAHRKAFRDSVAYDPVNDAPIYADYRVERAEINSPADEKNPNFSKTFKLSEAMEKETNDWSQNLTADVVENKYLDPVLTFPLGPLQNRAWGENAAHAPQVPFVSVDPAVRGRSPDGDAPADAAGARANPRGAAQGNTRTGGDRRSMAADTATDVDYKLLRFFDFSVEPGKSYVYRVALDLKNPNFNLDPAKLEKPEYAKEKYLTTPFSARTNRVDVPKNTQVLLGAAKPEDGKFPVTLLTSLKNGRSGYYTIQNVERGQVLNKKNETATVVVSSDATSRTSDQDAGDAKTDFLSDAVVLDMDGAKKMSGRAKLIVPREMLFMVINGTNATLTVRDELDDMSEVNRVTSKPETTTTPSSRTGVDRLLSPDTDMRSRPR